MMTLPAAPTFVEWFFGRPFAEKLESAPAPEIQVELAPHVPSALDEAFFLGFNLGLDREDVSAPEHFTRSEVRSFDAGWIAGKRRYDAQLEEMFASKEYGEWSDSISDRDVHPCGVC